jgi:hypothetical protein
MPLTDKGKEMLKSLRAEYGKDKGESVMYAMKNAGKITGIDHAKKIASGLKGKKSG